MRKKFRNSLTIEKQILLVVFNKLVEEKERNLRERRYCPEVIAVTRICPKVPTLQSHFPKEPLDLSFTSWHYLHDSRIGSEARRRIENHEPGIACLCKPS